MYRNARKEPEELLYLRALKKRCALTDKEERNLFFIEKGFLGERLYDQIFSETGHDNLLIYRDIWLEIAGGTVQLDSLIISDGEMVINEIKNYSGEYQYENGIWKVQAHQISEDPISQVRRAANKLIKMKYERNLNFDVDAKIIFPNPNFMLTAPEFKEQDMIVKREMLKKYLRDFQRRTTGHSAELLAGEIDDLIIENPYFKPNTDWSRLRLGFYCSNCGSFEVIKKRYHIACQECEFKEAAEQALVRMITDFYMLFPEEKMTVKKVGAFTGGMMTQDNLQKTIRKYCDLNGQGHSSHYKLKGIHYEEILASNNYMSRYRSEIVKVRSPLGLESGYY